MTDESEFSDFAAALGRLMTRGLNQLPATTQQMVSEAVEDGGNIFAICQPAPVSVAAMLSHGGKNIELFRVTDHVTLN